MPPAPCLLLKTLPICKPKGENQYVSTQTSSHSEDNTQVSAQLLTSLAKNYLPDIFLPLPSSLFSLFGQCGLSSLAPQKL